MGILQRHKKGELRLVLRRKRTAGAMTLLAACACTDYMVFAADSGVDTGGVMLGEQKIDYAADHPIAWWFTGDEALGREFGEWMHARPWSKIRDWNVLEGLVKDKVAEIVEPRLKAARNAGRICLAGQ